MQNSNNVKSINKSLGISSSKRDDDEDVRKISHPKNTSDRNCKSKLMTNNRTSSINQSSHRKKTSKNNNINTENRTSLKEPSLTISNMNLISGGTNAMDINLEKRRTNRVIHVTAAELFELDD
jgi:hypothetical protein